ncbi:hypothetical protein B0H10DRAFT_2449501 [Mycena sp. CBHHK59/15]|nr:hypothetical protein B0H10DRAFT_2449501 [Mycena sp. CBHHK59/15]
MVSARSAHAYRNPAKAVQPSRHRGKSTASKETKALNAAERLRRRINFDVDLDTFYAFRSAEITRIAKAHSKKEDAVRKLLSNATQYKVTRRPNLRNAIIHDRSRKAKADGDYGRIMSDLQGEVADDIEEGDYQLLKATMSAAEKKRLIDQLVEHRELGRRGARATNKAAAMDSMQTANGVRDALLDLFERTGVRSLAMFSRAHPDDTALPHVVDADESRDFFQQILGVSILDVLRKFEQWCCTQDEETKERNDVASVRKQIVLLVLEGLRRIKKNQMLNMSYVNYDIDIRQVLGVELAGWPTKITMDRPNKLSAEDARLIRDGLRSGAIHWVALTKTQKAELDDELDGRRTRGGPLKKRKLRSDAGKKRGPRRNKADGSDDEEDENADDDDDEEEEEEEEEEPAIASKSRNGAPAATTDSSSTSIPAALVSISGKPVPVGADGLPLCGGFDPTIFNPNTFDFSHLSDIDLAGLQSLDFNSIDLNFGSNDVGLGGGAFGFPMHFDAGHLVLPAPTLASAAPAGSVGGTTSVFSATTNTNVDTAGTHNKSNDAITSVPAPKTKKRKSASADDVPAAKKKRKTASADDPPRKRKERSDKGKQRGGDAENKSGGADDPPRKRKVRSDKGKQRAGNAEKGGE